MPGDGDGLSADGSADCDRVTRAGKRSWARSRGVRGPEAARTNRAHPCRKETKRARWKVADR